MTHGAYEARRTRSDMVEPVRVVAAVFVFTAGRSDGGAAAVGLEECVCCVL